MATMKWTKSGVRYVSGAFEIVPQTRTHWKSGASRLVRVTGWRLFHHGREVFMFATRPTLAACKMAACKIDVTLTRS